MTPRGRTAGHNGRVVSQVIDALIAGRGMRPDDVYLAAGLTRSTFYNRMARGDWKVTELADIAAYLDEPISSIRTILLVWLILMIVGAFFYAAAISSASGY